MIDYVGRLVRYDIWANRETLNSLEQSPPPPKSPKWMAWPDLDVQACGTQLDELSRLWPGYLAGLSADRLGETVFYTNSKGEPWTSTVQEILTHVTIHSASHRGQIAADLRSAGSNPATLTTSMLYDRG